ncbi:FAD-dependent monooxygenase [Microbacterium sp. KR10-403]|uniref:FAD-dependent monooxygenase n=1 Tax=Microbacterium sp. KR10-403 TaxID=3158581 RepID=UPI0032E48506
MALISSALVVGGGIAGLAAAIALEQIGVHVDVVELGERFGAVGAGMGIAGRAPDALAELGIYEEVAATGQPGLGAPGMYDIAGRLTSALPPAPPEGQGRGPIGAYRPAIAEILVRRARAAGAHLRTGLTVDAIDEMPDGVTVTLSGGEVRRYDILIGADGAYSRIRSLVFPDAPAPEYAGQMSIRWLADGDPIEPEGWYVAGAPGRMAFYYQPYPRKLYVPFVVNMPRTHLSSEDAYELVRDFMAQYTAPAIVELRSRLTPGDEIIPRPFDWLLLKEWSRGHVLLIGDAAHATTAHLGMGGGMALEDGVVLARCLAEADTVAGAYEAFFARRWERVRTVVETSVVLSQREQENLPPDPALMHGAMAVLERPY